MSPSSQAQPGRAASRVDGERSRERILDAAERLFAEHGYAGTGIAAISRESGLPASSIYWFFENKQDLATAVVERAGDRWLDALGAPHREGRPEDRLRRLMQRGLEQSGTQLPEFLRLEVMLALELGESGRSLLERFRTRRARAREVVGEALEGALAPLGKERAARMAAELVELTMAFAQGALIAGQMDPEPIDLERLPEEIGVAMSAIARYRLEQENP